MATGGAAYHVLLTPRAIKDLGALPGAVQVIVRARIDALAIDPRPHGCTNLKGQSGRYRIRIGDYRVVYEVNDASRAVLVVRVAHRRDVYRP